MRFVGFAIQSRTEVYAGAEQSSSAANFDTLRITLRARKAANDDEWQRAVMVLNSDLPASQKD
jgi:hypothetical protein